MNKADKTVLIVVLLMLVSVGGYAFYHFYWRKRNAPLIPATSPNGGQVNPGGSGTYNEIPSAVKQMPNGDFPLKRGDKNRRTYALQVALNFLHGTNLSEDGIFGPLTENAVVQNYGGAKIVTQETAILIMNKLNAKAKTDPMGEVVLRKIQATY